MSWVIMKIARIGSGENIKLIHVHESGFGEFDTRTSAIRAIMEGIDPELKGKPDEFLKLHWQRWSRNVGAHKIVRKQDDHQT